MYVYMRAMRSTHFEMRNTVLVSVFLASFWCTLCLAEYEALDHFHIEVSRANLREGDSYNVTCWTDSLAALNQLCGAGGVQRLYMQASRTNLTVSILNDTTIYHEMPSAQPMHGRAFGYECLCNGASIVSTFFPVGVRLQVVDFSCRFEDAKFPALFNCSFSRPPMSDTVDATANYTLQHDGRTVACQPVGQGLRMQCIGRLNNFQKAFNFTLRLHDQLGEHSQRFQLRREQMIVLERPGADFNVTSLNSSSICLEWSAKRSTNHIGYTIVWSKLLLNDNINNASVLWTDVKQATNRESVCLYRLPHPYQNYTIELQRRYNYSGAHLSPSFVYSFYTLPERPARPPRVWPNGYHIDPRQPNELHIYWQPLPQLEHNGPGFTYNVTVHRSSDPNRIIPAKVAVDSNEAVISDLELNSDSFTIVVRSQNSLGSSLNSSRIRIPWLLAPRRARRVPKNLDTGRRMRHLTWDPPEEQMLLSSYTVYWCSWNITDHTRCNEGLAIESAEVERCSQCQYEPPAGLLIDAYKWAVSANYDGRDAFGSGGMSWLEWYHRPLMTAVVQSDHVHNIQGIIALIILGGFIYFLVRKVRYMSNIKVDLPEGLQSVTPALTTVGQELPLLTTHMQQEQQQREERQEEHDQQTNLNARIHYPPVLYANFRPLDTLVPAQPQDYVRISKRAADLANPSGYICMQPTQPVKVTGYVSLP
ncbi:PREDICTED: cytokine receptor [Drosophila arizonae]|uniref:Cytokine receptor n=1 Tax=Drosophila arizonae TaxID=7263 RepID=A0ABM1PWN3_DROAR|nr:PREDICTED: cytokine receptor [Drosophila arizonae]